MMWYRTWTQQRGTATQDYVLEDLLSNRWMERGRSGARCVTQAAHLSSLSRIPSQTQAERTTTASAKSTIQTNVIAIRHSLSDLGRAVSATGAIPVRSKFLGSLDASMPCSLTPAGPLTQAMSVCRIVRNRFGTQVLLHGRAVTALAMPYLVSQVRSPRRRLSVTIEAIEHGH
jgi:hypothetical protein